jgi:hypothetical protein
MPSNELNGAIPGSENDPAALTADFSKLSGRKLVFDYSKSNINQQLPQ